MGYPRERPPERSAHDRSTRRLQRPDHRRVPRQPRTVGGRFEGAALLLLHTTGARSGTPYTNPVVHLEDDGCYVIFASKAGAPNNPGWYHNLKAHPEVTIEVGDETIEVTASEVTGEERDRLYDRQVQIMPGFAEYQSKAERVVPVVALTPKRG